MIFLVTITSQASLIWRHAVADFDTDTIVGGAVSGEYVWPDWIRKTDGKQRPPSGQRAPKTLGM